MEGSVSYPFVITRKRKNYENKEEHSCKLASSVRKCSGFHSCLCTRPSSEQCESPTHLCQFHRTIQFSSSPWVFSTHLFKLSIVICVGESLEQPKGSQPWHAFGCVGSKFGKLRDEWFRDTPSPIIGLGLVLRQDALQERLGQRSRLQSVTSLFNFPQPILSTCQLHEKIPCGMEAKIEYDLQRRGCFPSPIIVTITKTCCCQCCISHYENEEDNSCKIVCFVL